MNKNIFDRRREKNWTITFWCTPRSVVVQITLPSTDGEESDDSPDIDVALPDFSTAVKFAKFVCEKKTSSVAQACLLLQEKSPMLAGEFVATLTRVCSNSR